MRLSHIFSFVSSFKATLSQCQFRMALPDNSNDSNDSEVTIVYSDSNRVNQKTIFRDEYTRLICILRDMRENRRLSQAELGMLVGQDQSFVSKYENRVRRLDFLETLDICRVLEIDIHKLINELKNNENR